MPISLFIYYSCCHSSSVKCDRAWSHLIEVRSRIVVSVLAFLSDRLFCATEIMELMLFVCFNLALPDLLVFMHFKSLRSLAAATI